MAACGSAPWSATPTLRTTAPSPRTFPAVAEALLSGASAQLRNAATVGGNLLQRTRCPYFYDVASACNKREPGAGCDARDGENRTHAVLGWSDSCIATHPSDFCVPLVALDAVVEIEGRSGRREVPLEAFHLLPGDTPERETVLEPGDLVVAVRLPAEAAAFRAHARYLKVRERTSYAFALASAAAALDIDGGGVIRQARIALGGVATKPWRARAAEAALVGARAEAAAFARAADARCRRREPSGDNAFKIELARRVVTRALRACGRRHARRACPPSPPLPSPPYQEASPMAEISLSRDPAHLRQGSSIGQPLTRRDGMLKVTGRARYAADNHPAGMLHAVMAVSAIARGRVTFLDVEAAKAHPGVVEVMTPANRPELAKDPDAEGQPLRLPDRCAAERPGALCEPADRRRDRARRSRRRPRARPCSRRATRARCLASASMPETASCPTPSASASRQMRASATSKPAFPPLRSGSSRPTRRRRSTTTPWNRMRSSRRGTATRSRSTRRARASRWPACG